MYKKIQHNIVEEHFNHPPVVLRASWPPTPTRFVYSLDLKNQFSEFNQDLRDAIISTLANSDNNLFNQQKLVDTAAKFTSFFEPFYGADDAATITTYFTNLAKSLVEVATAKTSADIAAKKSIADTHIKDLVNFLNSINPNLNSVFLVPPITYLTTYTQAVYDQISNRENKNWAADSTAAKLASNIIAMGPVSISGFGNSPDFATTLANSIAQQFPGKLN